MDLGHNRGQDREALRRHSGVMGRPALFEGVDAQVVDRTRGGGDSSLARASRSPSVEAATVVVLLSWITVLHLVTAGRIPSGADGGNWLALARRMLGESVMSADVVYEPVFPGLLALLLRILAPVDALLVASLIAEGVLVFGVYVCVRRAGRLPALASAMLVGAVGYRLEAYAWGAYPQILALGVGTIVLWAAMRFIAGGGKRDLALALAGGLVVLLTHKLVGGLLMIAVPTAALHVIWLQGWPAAARRRAVSLVAGTWALGAFFIGSWLIDSANGVEPMLNPSGRSRLDHLFFAVREAPMPWLAIGLIGVAATASRRWDANSGLAVSASLGWVVAGTTGFLILGEIRALIQIQVGLVLLATLMVWRWWKVLSDAPRRRGVVVLAFTGAALAGSLIVPGLHRYTVATDWFRVVGESELAALSAMAEVSEPGDLAVASRGRNGIPIGWWVEGYAGVPTYTSHDMRLTFPDERRQAEQAARVFGGSPDEAKIALEETDARFVILDRRGPDGEWSGGRQPGGLTLVSHGTLLILDEGIEILAPISP